jgi:hypothetical protein
MSGIIYPLPQCAFMAWCLVKHRDNFMFLENSRYSPVGIATGYVLEDRVIRVRFPAGAGNFSL